jgi:predicted acyltransferase
MTDTAPSPSRRFASLDVFRGITIFLMILVNTAGPGAPAFTQLVHAKWIGFTWPTQFSPASSSPWATR